MNSEERIAAILSDPEVRRIGALIREEEARSGQELREGKHGRWERICVQNTGHETRTPHWGLTPDGAPVAWIGSTPDD